MPAWALLLGWLTDRFGLAMPVRRGYRQACGIARGLDIVGERWALLVVRELLLGPKPFLIG